MGNGESRAVAPQTNWQNFQNHINSLNTFMAQNIVFLSAHLKISQFNIETTLQYTNGATPQWVQRIWFNQRARTSL